MVTEINHDSFCFNAQRVTRLQLDPRLPEAVFSQVALDRLAGWKSTSCARLPESDFLRTGQLNRLSAPSNVRHSLEQAFQSGTSFPSIVQTLDRALDRFQAECLARASEVNLQLPPAARDESPYDWLATRAAVLQRLTSIQDRASEARAASEAEAAASLDRFNRLPPVDAGPEANTGPRLRWLLNHAPLWLGPVIGGGASLWIGQDNWSVALATLIGAASGFGVDRFRHRRAGSGMRGARPAVERPAVQLLSAYAAAKRSSHLNSAIESRASSLIDQIRNSAEDPVRNLEAELTANVASIPSASFVEIRPGWVQLTGTALVRALAESRRAYLENIPPSAARSSPALIDAASQAIGPVTLCDALDVVARDPRLRPQLEYHLKHNLELLARAAVTVRSDIGVNRSLCPEFVSIGLPEGDQDQLVPFVRSTFPGAGIIKGSRPDSLEIVYRVHNLPRSHLALHARSSPAYEKATTLERTLWHFAFE